MLANTLTIKDIDNSDVIYTRHSQLGTTVLYKNLDANFGADQTLSIAHKLTGKPNNVVRNTRIRFDDNVVSNAGVAGNVNGSININVPQSGLVIQDAHVENIIAKLRSALKEATVGAAMTVPFAETLKEGSL